VISPTTLSQNHDISPRLYQKVALQVKTAHGEWNDIDRLLITKGILDNTKLQTHLYIEDILKVLYKHNASCAILEKYLKLNYICITRGPHDANGLQSKIATLIGRIFLCRKCAA